MGHEDIDHRRCVAEEESGKDLGVITWDYLNYNVHSRRVTVASAVTVG